MDTALQASTDVVIDVQDVSFRYFESPNGVSNVSFKVHAGDRVLVLGQNGSGKSTLLSMIAGKRKPQGGGITVLGRDAFDDTSLNADVALIGPPWPPEAYFGNTVVNVASPCPDPERRDAIAQRLHLPLNAAVDRFSSGEKRRVQILFGLMRPMQVMLLDECSTDIDIAERRSVLELVRGECESAGRVCLYATHILDGVGEWATHVALMSGGKLERYMRRDEIPGEIAEFAHAWMARHPFGRFPPGPTEEELAAIDGAEDRAAPAVACTGLSYKTIFTNLTFSLRAGCRALLLACNGAGKTTLLNMLGGRLLFTNKNSELLVCGHPLYHDMKVNALVGFCGDWWTKAPTCQVYVREMLPAVLSPRAERLRQLLNVDLGWDVRLVSAGEAKRIQLLHALHNERRVVVLDEATSDLDVDQRHALLQFLYEESVERGVTVLYATHIFEGLGNWATDCVILDRTRKGVAAHMRGSIDLGVAQKLLCELKARETWWQTGYATMSGRIAGEEAA